MKNIPGTERTPDSKAPSRSLPIHLRKSQEASVAGTGCLRGRAGCWGEFGNWGREKGILAKKGA